MNPPEKTRPPWQGFITASGQENGWSPPCYFIECQQTDEACTRLKYELSVTCSTFIEREVSLTVKKYLIVGVF